MRSAEDTVAALIGNAGYGVQGVDLFTGPVRAAKESVPAEAVFVAEGAGTGGTPPRWIHNESKDLMRGIPVQVRVRDVTYGSGYERAQNVWATLATVRTPGGWTQMTMSQSSPLYIGRTDDELFHWSINIELIG